MRILYTLPMHYLHIPVPCRAGTATVAKKVRHFKEIRGAVRPSNGRIVPLLGMDNAL